MSRLAKWMGFSVLANDWEYFSFVFNYAFLHSQQEILDAFKGEQNCLKLIDYLNQLAQKKDKKPVYLAKYYAPKSFEIEGDFKGERLFYTRENALRIDVIREEIERLYLAGELSALGFYFLVALLIKQAATHTNTSGVFKAYYKHFGGYGRDALKRITTPIKLQMPNLSKLQNPVILTQQDATEITIPKQVTPWITYLDPPYNQHQYGSNYHLLNSIALWDQAPVSLDRDESGNLKDKSGIRKDWMKTKSPFCQTKEAIVALEKVFDRIESPFILLSYSSEGLIPFDALFDLAQNRGKCELLTKIYTKFPGGRQSSFRLTQNIEFIIKIDRQVKKVCQKKKALKLLKIEQIHLLSNKWFHTKKIQQQETLKDSRFSKQFGNASLQIHLLSWYHLKIESDLTSFSFSDLNSIEEYLSSFVFVDAHQFLLYLFECLKKNPQSLTLPQLTKEVRLILRVLKKLAYRKTSEVFSLHFDTVSEILKGYPQDKVKLLKAEQESLLAQMHKRMGILK